MRDSRRPCLEWARGCTIVETVVALSIGGTLLGIALAVLTHSVTWIQSSDERTDPREMAHMALLSLRQTLVDAFSYSISDGGTRLKYATTRGEGEVYHDPTKGSLTMRRPGQSGLESVPGRTTLFLVQSVIPGYIQVCIEIERPSRRKGTTSPAPFRIVDSIVLPCAMPSDPGFPWNCPSALLAATPAN